MKICVMDMSLNGNQEIYETEGDDKSFKCPACHSIVPILYFEGINRNSISNVDLECPQCEKKYGIKEMTK